MLATILLTLALQGEPQPQSQRDTTSTQNPTTEQNDAPRKKINIVIKLPGMKIPLYV